MCERQKTSCDKKQDNSLCWQFLLQKICRIDKEIRNCNDDSKKAHNNAGGKQYSQKQLLQSFLTILIVQTYKVNVIIGS